MRLKTFTAPTMAEAMNLVREQLGVDAIIVSSQTGSSPEDGGSGCRVTAAIEEAEPVVAPAPADNDANAAVEAHDAGLNEHPRHGDALIRQMLVRHGTPPRLVERLMRIVGDLEEIDPTTVFAAALDTEFSFRPLGTPSPGERIMLVGPPGAGKTITTAKLAAQARLAKTPAAVVTTDTRRAGGVEQLSAFTRILDIELGVAEDAAALTRVLADLDPTLPVYIDSGGANPFSEREMGELRTFVDAALAEPVLILPAGGDALETADIAAAFARVGCRRLVVTRLDMARRLGSLLAAAHAGRLAFSDVSINPQVADGLSPINPVSLARLMMPDVALGAHARPTATPIEAAS